MELKTLRPFGIEIECAILPEKVSQELVVQELKNTGIAVLSENESFGNERYSTWVIKYEPSIPAGFELVSPKLAGKPGLDQIEKVSFVLKQLGIRVNSQCGLHVHVDASDMNSLWLQTILKRYQEYEPTLDSFVVKTRRGNANTYCQSMIPIMNNLTMTINEYTPLSEIVDRINTIVGPANRRHQKLNVNALTKHKSLEFRHHGGTVDSNKMIPWVVLCLNLVETSKVEIITTTETVESVIESSSLKSEEELESDKTSINPVRKNAIIKKYIALAKVLDSHQGPENFASYLELGKALDLIDQEATEISKFNIHAIANYCSKFKNRYNLPIQPLRNKGYFKPRADYIGSYENSLLETHNLNTTKISKEIKNVTTKKIIQSPYDGLWYDVPSEVVSYFLERNFELN